MNTKYICPFCGGTSFSENEWCLDDEPDAPALECNSCLAGAPLNTFKAFAKTVDKNEQLPD